MRTGRQVGNRVEARLQQSMAAGCEGNSVPEAAGCGSSLCQRLLDGCLVWIVDVQWW